MRDGNIKSTIKCKKCKKLIKRTYCLILNLNERIINELEEDNNKVSYICYNCYKLEKLKE